MAQVRSSSRADRPAGLAASPASNVGSTRCRPSRTASPWFPFASCLPDACLQGRHGVYKGALRAGIVQTLPAAGAQAERRSVPARHRATNCSLPLSLCFATLPKRKPLPSVPERLQRVATRGGVLRKQSWRRHCDKVITCFYGFLCVFCWRICRCVWAGSQGNAVLHAAIAMCGWHQRLYGPTLTSFAYARRNLTFNRAFKRDRTT